MNITFLYLAAKTVHIASFILAVGVVVCTFLSYTYFWDLFDQDREKGLAAFRAFNRLQRTGMVSLAVVLIAGIAMLPLGDWRLLQVHWFQIKLALVALIFVNGFTLGRSSTLRLRAFLDGKSTGPDEPAILKRKLGNFQILQLSIYAAIIVVSVFRVL